MSKPIISLIQITTDELQEEHRVLWEAMSDVVNDAQLCVETQVPADNETIAMLCLIAMSYCRSCGSIDYNCQCWNDE